jgi:enoyl-CoA hydratase/carnithine racemase
MAPEAVLYHREGRITYITLNRPHVLNAVSKDLELELTRAFRKFDVEAEAWVAILHGAGRAFCAGADVKERFAVPSPAERDLEWGMGQNPEGFLGRCINWKPVIAAVHGHCLAWGLLIAAECDLIVASEDASFGLTETLRGFPGGPAWAKLNTFMPSKVATEMLLTGTAKPAAELHHLGLINRLVPQGKHLEAAKALAEEIMKAPPLAVRAGVRVSRWPWVRRAAEADYYQAPLRLHLTQDFEESARAFVEKRRPEFKGR